MTHDTFQLPDVCHATQQRIYRRRPSRQRYHRSQPTSPDPLTSRSTCNPKVVPGRALTPLPCRTEICLGMAANCRGGKGTEGKGHDEGGRCSKPSWSSPAPAAAADPACMCAPRAFPSAGTGVLQLCAICSTGVSLKMKLLLLSCIVSMVLAVANAVSTEQRNKRAANAGNLHVVTWKLRGFVTDGRASEIPMAGARLNTCTVLPFQTPGLRSSPAQTLKQKRNCKVTPSPSVGPPNSFFA